MTAVGVDLTPIHVGVPPVRMRREQVEYALPLEHAGEAMQRIRTLIEQLGVTVNFITEVRFVKADDAWMSPASERDSCQLGAYMADAPGIDAYFSGFEQEMRQLGGRPHWGKEFTVDGPMLCEMYPRMQQFIELARELDPDGVLRNPFLDRVLSSPQS